MAGYFLTAVLLRQLSPGYNFRYAVHGVAPNFVDVRRDLYKVYGTQADAC